MYNPTSSTQRFISKVGAVIPRICPRLCLAPLLIFFIYRSVFLVAIAAGIVDIQRLHLKWSAIRPKIFDLSADLWGLLDQMLAVAAINPA